MTKNLFLNKQIILATGMIVFIAAAVIGGTGAFFSDTETSTGNVFTAGDVALSLASLTHTYLADEPLANLPTNYVNIDGNKKSFQFGDLKPLDWGAMNGVLTNVGNAALVCARVVATNVPSTATSPFQNLLKFRVNNGLGLTAAQTFGIAPLNQWFSLNPAAPALAMAAGQTLPSQVQYCFGDFVAGTPGVLGSGDCVINPAANYNLAQNQSLTLDIEYYAVQSRNNSGFTCASLNPQPVVYTATSSVLGFSSTGWGGWSCNAGDTAIGGTVYQADGVTPVNPSSLTSSSIAGVNTSWPHHIFGATETGFVVQNGAVGQSLVIAVQCQAS